MSSIPNNYRVCTAEENRAMDAFTIHKFGIPSFTLMEIAGAKTASTILPRLKPESYGLVLCGKGNNAGDALVVTRHLHRMGFHFDLVFISGTDDLSEDTSKNLSFIRKLIDAENEPSITITEGWQPDQIHTEHYSFIIDGLLGTGLSSDLRGNYTKAVTWANQTGLPIYSIDVPTGLHADTGEILGNCIHASLTCTYGTLKSGFYINDGPDYTGEIVFCDLGFPKTAPLESERFVIDEAWVDQQQSTAANRHPRHKYEAGVVYLIAGSEGLTGAVQLAAHSAWRMGVGAVTVIIPHGLLPVFETTLVHQVKNPVGSRDDLHFKPSHIDGIMELIHHRPGSVLLGPGLGRHSETVSFVHKLVDRLSMDLVIDADGLWCIAQGDFPEIKHDAPWILTPHPGELSELTGKSATADNFERMKIAEGLAQEHGITVVSKGMPTYVSQAEYHTLMTTYDTTVFSRTGYGDILAGKIAAGLALGYEPVISCAKALLDGRRKYDHALKVNNYPPEPLDLV
ncbi:MAG TPA: NAD(P)H-hydrate epimerase [Balneolales bacterium]|nr:NAD(P)H-hydrate epimerase [Balneolales bacterium]